LDHRRCSKRRVAENDALDIGRVGVHKFAELNVIGQWLGIPDVIDRHYDDQLNQAVGRNRGFRLSDKRATTTQVITSPRLWQKVLRNRQDRPQRVQLYIAANPDRVRKIFRG
jgi:hypothetical protein